MPADAAKYAVIGILWENVSIIENLVRFQRKPD